jgi:hypothetical protein
VSVKIIAELNPASVKRTTLSADPKPVADIVRELDSGFPLSQARVSRNGEIVRDFSILARDGDALWIKFVPYGTTRETGIAMKAGGWALTALVLATALFSPALAFSVLGIVLIGTGISLAAGGMVLMNIDLNIPSVKDREKPENDPSVRGGKNQARPHGRIPVLFGRHRLYPDLAANPHTEIINDKQYYTQLFCGGYKDCVIDVSSFKLGETSLVDLSQTKDIARILSDGDPLISMEILQDGRESKLYPRCVHEDAINAPLTHEIEGADGVKTPGEIIRTTPDKTDAINVDVFLYNGIGKYNSSGDLKSASVQVRAWYKNAKDNSPYQPLGFFGDPYIGDPDTISGAELRTKRRQITKENLPPGQYTVKIERVTPDSNDSNVIDQVNIGSIRSFKSTPPVRGERRGELTLIAMRVMATSRLNGVVDGFNYVATSKLPVYSGGGSGPLYWLGAAETRNPAAALLYALRGRAAQQSVDADDVDWPAFEAFYQWCEAHEYFCDACLSESVTIARLLAMIGAAARADILRIDSKISVAQDIERPAPVQLFTPKNTKSYSAAMFSADIPDAISLRYIDEDAGYAQNELSVYNTPDGNPGDEPPETVQKVDLWGVANSAQARRIGMYNYGCLGHRPFVHTIEVDIEYLLCNKGDWIQYAGDIALTGAAQGRVVQPLFSDGLCVGVRVDEPVAMEAGKQYAVRLRRPDGAVILKDAAAVREPDEIYFTEPFDADDGPRSGDVYAYGVRGREALDLVITDIQPQADLCAALTCVEYSPEIFGVDDPHFILPEFENKITPVSGAVDSGAVSPNKWKLFAAYHDGDAEPPRPSGDGQGGGWHYARTLRSIWQSGKMAEAVDSGEWGPPVRIKNERGDTDVIPVYLTLSPQSRSFECDGDGNILAGLLPFTSQARLFKWNTPIPLSCADMPRFSGSDGNLFDPMPGDFYPVARSVEFSLSDAPPGVGVNEDGLITIAADAELDDENSVTVRALYLGEAYTAVLFISRDMRTYAARYLGTVDALPPAAQVTILKGPVSGPVRARQGDYVLAVAGGQAGHSWLKGYVYQWTGLAWEERSPEHYADLYTRCFADGLDVPELTRDMGWFGAVFARRIFALEAFIEKLETQVITLKRDGVIQSETITNGERDVLIKANGEAVFNKARIRGHIEADSGTLNNVTIKEQAIFLGTVNSGPVFISNENTTPVTPTVFASGTMINSIRNFLGTGTHNINGAYGSRTDIVSIVVVFVKKGTVVTVHPGGMYGTEVDLYSLRLIFSSGSDVYFEDKIVPSGNGSTLSSPTITQQLSIGGSVSGKVFRITDLPTGGAGLPPGTVYRNGNQLMIAT